MKKKFISMLLVSAMAATMIAGCGSKPAEAPAEAPAEEAPAAEAEAEAPAEEAEAPAEEAPAEEAPAATIDTSSLEGKDYSGVELVYWSMWNNNEPQGLVLQEAADAFSQATGATVKIEWKGRDIKTLLATELGAKGDIDIFEDSADRISKNLTDYTLDLTEMAAAAGYDDISFKCFNDQVKGWADGKLVCITEQPQVGGIFYNKDIFEACGITELPTTWDEFMAACQTMVDNGYQPLALDTAYVDFNLGYHLQRHLGQDAVKELSLNGGWSQNEQVIKAGDELVEFVNSGFLAEGAPDEYPSSQNKIGLTGKVAMIACANYVCTEVDNNSGVKTNWGLMNYPLVEGGVEIADAYAGANSVAIANYTENPEAAFDFVMFLVSGSVDQKMAEAAQQIPADVNNTEPAIMSGTMDTLNATAVPVEWGGGLNENGDLQTSFKEVGTKLFEGAYADGTEFAEAMDALY